MSDSMKVGVYPADALQTHQRLWKALEQAFPVRFEEMVPPRSELDAGLFLSGDPSIPQRTAAAGVRCYAVISNSENRTHTAQVRFGHHPSLDTRLRDCILIDRQAREIPIIVPKRGDRVLASSGDAPIWLQQPTQGAPVDWVSASPEELAVSETLRHHLVPGRLIGLLPLIHFLRDLTAGQGWLSPPLRACYVLDDPNLRTLSYGYLHYPTLVAHAEQHNYHVAIATIPRDGWLANRRVAQFFRQHTPQISLLMHGNDHVYGELDRPLSEAQYQGILAQALKRIARLERKTELSVARVMAPPHELCSDLVIRTMLRLGFEAVCTAAPYSRCLSMPQDQPPAEWGLAEMVAGGFPVIHRVYEKDIDELPLRAFLDQPLIVYGHHSAAAQELAMLSTVAARVNAFGTVHWRNMQDIVRSNYLTRRDGEQLRIRMYARHISLIIPEGIREVVVETAYAAHVAEEVLIDNSHTPLRGAALGSRTASLPLTGPRKVHIRLIHPELLCYQEVANPPRRLWPIFRRLLTETRDRTQPHLGRS